MYIPRIFLSITVFILLFSISNLKSEVAEHPNNSDEVLTDNNKYPEKPEDVLRIALDLMHKGEFAKGAEYYHPEFFEKTPNSEWEKIKDVKPEGYILAPITYGQVDDFQFKDGKLVEMTAKEIFIGMLKGFKLLMEQMNTDVYTLSEVDSVIMANDTIAQVEFKIEGLVAVGDSQFEKTMVPYIATLKKFDEKWKIYHERGKIEKEQTE